MKTLMPHRVEPKLTTPYSRTGTTRESPQMERATTRKKEQKNRETVPPGPLRIRKVHKMARRVEIPSPRQSIRKAHHKKERIMTPRVKPRGRIRQLVITLRITLRMPCRQTWTSSMNGRKPVTGSGKRTSQGSGYRLVCLSKPR